MNYVSEDFKHGNNFKIGKFCIIEENVTVGNNVEICNYVELKKGTVIGDNCFIDSKVISSGNNRIGNNVIIRYHAIIAKTVNIMDNVFIAPNVMTIFSKASGEQIPNTTIGSGAFIGTAAVLSAGVKIAPNCIIGEMSLVRKDCNEEALYCGIPAKKIRNL